MRRNSLCVLLLKEEHTVIQLRVRTEYSFGQTYAPVPRLLTRLKEMGCTAAGIVDATTWGHVAWWRACTKAGIQPLLGVECVVTDTDAAPRMWFLARTTTGLAEMYRLCSRSATQPLKGKFGVIPRLTRADVLGISDQILVFAGDVVEGPFLRHAKAIVDLNPGSQLLNRLKLDLARAYQLRVVSTSDNAYAYPEDRATFEFMAKAGLKPSPQHLVDIAPGHEWVAQACADLHLPHAPMVRTEGNLELLCRQGQVSRAIPWTPVYETRLQYELDLIRSKDFESYFLIVADMVQYAKQHMLVGPSRGSAAGSLVCYLARITEIDPVASQLFFERFIDVTRKDLPDIDLDFPDAKRHLVFDYMTQKYGAGNVAHIGNVVRMAPRSALIQVCKALGIPATATAALKVAMIERSVADARASNCLEDTFTTTKPGQEFIRAYPQAAIASALEGHAAHTSIHAAGLLVCNEPLTNYATVDETGRAHVEMKSVEALGLLKIDVLGLRTLSILEDSGVPIDWYNLPLNDPRVFDVFNQGRLCGIFQFEGNALRTIAAQIHSTRIEDIDAITALARPGPFATGVTHKYILRMNGERYEPIHPLVETHMADTYGLPIYQEQTLAIVRAIGKFNWEETSFIRKGIAKRMGKEFFDTYWSRFRDGATSQGIGEDEARVTWELINAMGSWQMNKAHTRSYAVISYWCAYLKAYHPLEFAASNLRHAKDEESAVELLREMVNEGIEYVAFDAEQSVANWSVVEGKLMGGLTSLKGIGASKAAKYLAARAAGTLTAAQRTAMASASNVFADLFPHQTRFGDLYRHPERHGIVGPITYIKDLVPNMPHGCERVMIGTLIYKNPRSANEEVNVKKRNGVLATGELEYLDIRVRDDTGMIGGRISTRDYRAIGVELAETIPLGTPLLLRARFYLGYRYIFIQQWKRLDV